MAKARPSPASISAAAAGTAPGAGGAWLGAGGGLLRLRAPGVRTRLRRRRGLGGRGALAPAVARRACGGGPNRRTYRAGGGAAGRRRRALLVGDLLGERHALPERPHAERPPVGVPRGVRVVLGRGRQRLTVRGGGGPALRGHGRLARGLSAGLGRPRRRPAGAASGSGGLGRDGRGRRLRRVGAGTGVRRRGDAGRRAGGRTRRLGRFGGLRHQPLRARHERAGRLGIGHRGRRALLGRGPSGPAPAGRLAVPLALRRTGVGGRFQLVPRLSAGIAASGPPATGRRARRRPVPPPSCGPAACAGTWPAGRGHRRLRGPVRRGGRQREGGTRTGRCCAPEAAGRPAPLTLRGPLGRLGQRPARPPAARLDGAEALGPAGACAWPGTCGCPGAGLRRTGPEPVPEPGLPGICGWPAGQPTRLRPGPAPRPCGPAASPGACGPAAPGRGPARPPPAVTRLLPRGCRRPPSGGSAGSPPPSGVPCRARRRPVGGTDSAPAMPGGSPVPSAAGRRPAYRARRHRAADAPPAALGRAGPVAPCGRRRRHRAERPACPAARRVRALLRARTPRRRRPVGCAPPAWAGTAAPCSAATATERLTGTAGTARPAATAGVAVAALVPSSSGSRLPRAVPPRPPRCPGCRAHGRPVPASPSSRCRSARPPPAVGGRPAPRRPPPPAPPARTRCRPTGARHLVRLQHTAVPPHDAAHDRLVHRVAAAVRAAHLDPYDITALRRRHHDRRVAGSPTPPRHRAGALPVESTPATSAIRCASACASRSASTSASIGGACTANCARPGPISSTAPSTPAATTPSSETFVAVELLLARVQPLIAEHVVHERRHPGVARRRGGAGSGWPRATAGPRRVGGAACRSSPSRSSSSGPRSDSVEHGRAAGARAGAGRATVVGATARSVKVITAPTSWSPSRTGAVVRSTGTACPSFAHSTCPRTRCLRPDLRVSASGDSSYGSG